MIGARDRLGSTPIGFADLELAKWIALATMAIDHYGKIVDPGIFLETHAIGRVSFPLFAAIIGLRLARRPALADRYIRRLIPWAIISQPIFVIAGRNWHDGNIMVTLLLGVVATMALYRRESWPRSRIAVAAAAVLGLSWFAEFGPLGVMLVPAVAVAAAANVTRALWLVGPLGLAANMVPAWPPLAAVDLPALLSPLVLLGSVHAKPALPRLPGIVFYGFYPAHLLALHLYDLYG